MTELTSVDIDSMPAGREMDALVAELVFGWEWRVWIKANETEDDMGVGIFSPQALIETPKDIFGNELGIPPAGERTMAASRNDPRRQRQYWGTGLPNYSTDISDAWLVVEKLVGKDCTSRDLFIECWSDGEWFVAFHPMGYSSREPKAVCDGKETGKSSAPLAICRVALKAMNDR